MVDRNPRSWKKLDNAGKLFSSVARKGDAKVFRFSCELFAPVDGGVLQKAAESAVAQFPLYRYILKGGIFWYYLENSNLQPKVKEEDAFPCSPLYNHESKTFLFEISYYKRRINLEVFHVLSDGAGALQFLKTLVCFYLKYAHPAALAHLDPTLGYDASEQQQQGDSFAKYYSGKRRIRAKSVPKAHQVKGPREKENRVRIIEGIVSTKAMLAKAHENHCTVTALLTGVLIDAIHSQMNRQQERRPVVIGIPVNLRSFFKSESMRNFFGLIFVDYDYSAMPDDFSCVTAQINNSLKAQLTAEQLSERIDKLSALEHKLFLQVIPLATKNLALLIANLITAQGVTASVSNLGAVEMPAELKDYIRLFDIFFPTNKPQLCLCSYGDNMNISFTSPFCDTDLPAAFFRRLRSMGLELEIVSNNLEEGERKGDRL